MSDLPTIQSVVESHVSTDAPPEVLIATLIEREDRMADMLRMAGMQFGLYPQIVAEVFAEVGIGTPVPDEARQMIRAQYTALMEDLQRQFREGQG